jgi:IstB-like ATP binding protein
MRRPQPTGIQVRAPALIACRGLLTGKAGGYEAIPHRHRDPVASSRGRPPATNGQGRTRAGGPRMRLADVGHLGYLPGLWEREFDDRERRATERRIEAARRPRGKLLDHFDSTAQPSLGRPLVRDMARCAFIDRRASVILAGRPRTGRIPVPGGQRRLAAWQEGALTEGDRAADAVAWGPREPGAGPPPRATGSAETAGGERSQLRAGQPSRGGAATRSSARHTGRPAPRRRSTWRSSVE